MLCVAVIEENVPWNFDTGAPIAIVSLDVSIPLPKTFFVHGEVTKIADEHTRRYLFLVWHDTFHIIFVDQDAVDKKKKIMFFIFVSDRNDQASVYVANT